MMELLASDSLGVILVGETLAAGLVLVVLYFLSRLK